MLLMPVTSVALRAPQAQLARAVVRLVRQARQVQQVRLVQQMACKVLLVRLAARAQLVRLDRQAHSLSVILVLLVHKELLVRTPAQLVQLDRLALASLDRPA